MSKGFFNVPIAKNEPILSYAPGTKERTELQEMLRELRSQEIELPMVIGGNDVFTDRKVRMFPPHEIKHTLGYYSQGNSSQENENNSYSHINALLRLANSDIFHKCQKFLATALN